jgi:hypothetical protein
MADQRAIQPVTPAKPTELMELPPVKSTAAIFVDDFLTLAKVADGILKSNFAPKGLKDVTDVVLVLMTGQELGLSYAQSLRMLYVVNGRPTLAADAMAAVVKRFCAQRGGGFLRVVEQTAKACTVEYQRHDEPAPSTVQFTIEDARTANLLGKDVWKQYPQDMLRARALSRACRTGWPDVLGGVYDPDEAAPAVETTYRVSTTPVTEPPRTAPAIAGGAETPAAVEAEAVETASRPVDADGKEIPASKRAAIDELIKLAAKATVNEQDLLLIAWHQCGVQALEELDGKGIYTVTKLLQKAEGDLADVVFAARDALAAYDTQQADQN